MADSDNHAYNVPQQGAQDWHIPLNENFEDFDTDIELRDADANKGNYDPKLGAKFLATDTGVVYEGDGTNWVPTLAQSRVIESSTAGAADNLVAGHPSNAVQNNAVAATIAGGGYDDGNAASPNIASGNYDTVGGGSGNTTSGGHSTVGGGSNNDANGLFATIAGGLDNEVTDNANTVAGGERNTVNAEYGTVAGGERNTVDAEYGTVAGGGPSDTTDVNTKFNTRNAVYDNYGTVGGGGGNVAGTNDNDATNGDFATVAGGQDNEASGALSAVGGGRGNTSSGDASVVSGGHFNESTAGNATICGGFDNDATAQHATIGGGSGHTVSGQYAVVPGGQQNTADGDHSFAAGQYADAADYNTFVWADGSDSASDRFSSGDAPNGSGVTGSQTFNVKASNGVKFVNGAGTTYIPSGSTGWTATSTRAAKTNIQTVNPLEALDGVRSLEIASWEYRNGNGDTSGTTHIGPMAEDFHAAFDCGDSDEHINSINADGVAFAAIQGLAEQVEARDTRIHELEARDDQRREEMEALREEVAALREEI